jgi:hypothetical protein
MRQCDISWLETRERIATERTPCNLVLSPVLHVQAKPGHVQPVVLTIREAGMGVAQVAGPGRFGAFVADSGRVAKRRATTRTGGSDRHRARMDHARFRGTPGSRRPTRFAAARHKNTCCSGVPAPEGMSPV